MEDFKYVNMPEFKTKCLDVECDVSRLKEITSNINNCFTKRQENFKGLCYWLKELKLLFFGYKSYYNGFNTVSGIRYSFERYCSELIGLDERYVNKCIQCYEKFMQVSKVGAGDSLAVEFIPGFEKFNKSKLFELLSVSNETLLDDISSGKLCPEMSRREVRSYVNALKGKRTVNKVVEDTSTEEPEQEIFDVSTIDISKVSNLCIPLTSSSV